MGRLAEIDAAISRIPEPSVGTVVRTIRSLRAAHAALGAPFAGVALAGMIGAKSLYPFWLKPRLAGVDLQTATERS